MISQGKDNWAKGVIPEVGTADVTSIISRNSDIAVVISRSGLVKEMFCNPEYSAAQSLEGLAGSPFRDSLNFESGSKFDARLKQFLDGSGSVLPVEVNHKTTDGRSELPVRYSFHGTGQDQLILMLGSDLRSVADMQQQLVAAQIALENDYELQRDHEIRFRVLMESSSTATVLVSVNSGTVTACNAAAVKLLEKPREALIDAAFAQGFESKGREDVIDRLIAAASEQSTSPVIAKSTQGNRKLSLMPTLFRGEAGQMLLCKIKVAGGQEQSADKLHTQLSALYQSGVDAMVFVDASGQILSSNESFPRLADITHSPSIQGRPLADFLVRGSVDVNIMLENARRTGAMRLYATRLTGEHGFERAVEISTTLINADGQTLFGMIMRDSRRVETLQTSKKQITDVDMQSVIELIGGQSLKDIVARTTDVVEKMCIETAVEMTSNNRVAAAEMLGLSRQSLYVKLRKYGLGSKN